MIRNTKNSTVSHEGKLLGQTVQVKSEGVVTSHMHTVKTLFICSTACVFVHMHIYMSI